MQMLTVTWMAFIDGLNTFSEGSVSCLAHNSSE